MKSYTPGPWHADGPQICGDGTDQDVDGCVVARVTTGYDTGRFFANFNRHPDICAANARLIAAAPELYEALRAIQEFCDDPHGSEKPESLMDGLVRLLPAARAAIAKAQKGHP